MKNSIFTMEERKMNMKINLQLWSIKDDTNENFFGALEQVAAMGYDGVEFAGFGGISAEDMKKKLDELHLEGVSAHLSYDEVTKNLDANIAYLKTIGAKFIVCPWAEIRDTKSATEIAAVFNEVGKKCKENGLTFCYHNHDHEFKADTDGKYPMDVLAENTNPEYVTLQPDVFWVKYAGVDPYAYLEKNKAICPMLHFKQIAENNHDNVDAQDGILDFKKMAEICPDAVYVYEQEEYPGATPMECVAHSAKYFK